MLPGSTDGYVPNFPLLQIAGQYSPGHTCTCTEE